MNLSEVFTAFDSALEQLKEANRWARAKESELDTKVSDIYHVLEFTKLDAVKMMKLTVQLKALLLQRREIKNQRAILHSFFENHAKVMTVDFKGKMKEKDLRKEQIKQEAQQTYEGFFGVISEN